MSLGGDLDGDRVGPGKDQPVQIVLTGNRCHFLDGDFNGKWLCVGIPCIGVTVVGTNMLRHSNWAPLKPSQPSLQRQVFQKLSKLPQSL